MIVAPKFWVSTGGGPPKGLKGGCYGQMALGPPRDPFMGN